MENLELWICRQIIERQGRALYEILTNPDARQETAHTLFYQRLEQALDDIHTAPHKFSEHALHNPHVIGMLKMLEERDFSASKLSEALLKGGVLKARTMTSADIPAIVLFYEESRLPPDIALKLIARHKRDVRKNTKWLVEAANAYETGEMQTLLPQTEKLMTSDTVEGKRALHSMHGIIVEDENGRIVAVCISRIAPMDPANDATYLPKYEKYFNGSVQMEEDELLDVQHAIQSGNFADIFFIGGKAPGAAVLAVARHLQQLDALQILRRDAHVRTYTLKDIAFTDEQGQRIPNTLRAQNKPCTLLLPKFGMEISGVQHADLAKPPAYIYQVDNMKIGATQSWLEYQASFATMLEEVPDALARIGIRDAKSVPGEAAP